jgi:hypothetical protein
MSMIRRDAAGSHAHRGFGFDEPVARSLVAAEGRGEARAPKAPGLQPQGPVKNGADPVTTRWRRKEVKGTEGPKP